jgi:hypothetical protein
MNLRPQTLYGLADSPVQLAAWMLDHDVKSYEDIARAFVDDDPVGNLTRDEVLDNITMTWTTNTGISSVRLYWENTLGFTPTSSTSTRSTGRPLRGLARAGALHDRDPGLRSGHCDERRTDVR